MAAGGWPGASFTPGPAGAPAWPGAAAAPQQWPPAAAGWPQQPLQQQQQSPSDAAAWFAWQQQQQQQRQQQQQQFAAHHAPPAPSFPSFPYASPQQQGPGTYQWVPMAGHGLAHGAHPWGGTPFWNGVAWVTPPLQHHPPAPASSAAHWQQQQVLPAAAATAQLGAPPPPSATAQLGAPLPPPATLAPSVAPLHAQLAALAATQDALQLLRLPGRADRPPRLAVIVRGIPGSGKSRLAKAIRDAEVAAGGAPPRILSLDDYFMVEEEREVADDEGPAAGAGRPRRRVERELRYEYDAAMEASYGSQLLRAFRRATQEPAALHPFIIVDAPVLTARELAVFAETGTAGGYVVMHAQPGDMEPTTCALRGKHGRTLADATAAAAAWEAAPPSVTRLDVTTLLAELESAGSFPQRAADQARSPQEGTAAAPPSDAGLGVSRWGAASEAEPGGATGEGRRRRGRTAMDGAAGAAEEVLREPKRRRKSVIWADQVAGLGPARAGGGEPQHPFWATRGPGMGDALASSAALATAVAVLEDTAKSHTQTFAERARAERQGALKMMAEQAQPDVATSIDVGDEEGGPCS